MLHIISFFTSHYARSLFSARVFGVSPQTTALRALLVGIWASMVLPAHAGRPMATDDVDIIEAGACQLEVWIERTRDSRGTWLNPGCNPFGSTEFSLGGSRVHEDSASAFTVHQWQIKQMLRAHDVTQTGLAVALGGQQVHQGEARETFLNGIATIPLAGEAQLLHLNLGALHDRDGQPHRTRLTWGLAYDAEIAGATRASLETYGTSGERANWQFGLRHELVPGRVQIDASVGSAIERWADTCLFTVGLVFVSSAFLH
ncbi:hypothetical protein [Thioalkalivibrio denitrificans]|nr:hypothetical protein [Thioalkalivibrio denitrificans]